MRAYTSTLNRDYLRPYYDLDDQAQREIAGLRSVVVRARVLAALPYLTDIERIRHGWRAYVAAPLVEDPSGCAEGVGS